MNRKELVRRYKETPRPMGVFRIRNTVTGFSLVASSIDVPAILNRQKAQLKFGGHPTVALQREWNEHGAEAFEFEVLDLLTPPDDPEYDPTSDLIALEELWLEKLQLSPDRWHTMIPRQPKLRT